MMNPHGRLLLAGAACLVSAGFALGQCEPSAVEADPDAGQAQVCEAPLPAADFPPDGDPRGVTSETDASAPPKAGDLPSPFPQQTKAELDYIDDVLAYWEMHSDKIESYSADFKRWVTDPVFGPADVPNTFSQGEIRYESSDRALFRVDQTRQWQAPTADRKDQYVDLGEAGKEQWVCDGTALYEFNYTVKKLIERKLPPELQGRVIADGLPFAQAFAVAYGWAYFGQPDGPLPFAFGARKETIKARYWLRATTTPEAAAKGECWIEAYPKRREEATNYSKIEFIIDGSDFLPSAIKIYERNHVETVYQFDNRMTNRTLDPQELLTWQKAFRPKTPPGWERRVEKAPTGPVMPHSLLSAIRQMFQHLN